MRNDNISPLRRAGASLLHKNTMDVTNNPSSPINMSDKTTTRALYMAESLGLTLSKNARV